ncbi:MAG TPA: hypothetical protein V6D28_27935 [Leptolyngbyaceae cyanobacterium]
MDIEQEEKRTYFALDRALSQLKVDVKDICPTDSDILNVELMKDWLGCVKISLRQVEDALEKVEQVKIRKSRIKVWTEEDFK